MRRQHSRLRVYEPYRLSRRTSNASVRTRRELMMPGSAFAHRRALTFHVVGPLVGCVVDSVVPEVSVAEGVGDWVGGPVDT
jgi:hypothetical protein